MESVAMVVAPTQNRASTPNIVVLIPCLNEEQTIDKVIRDFQTELPGAQIIVYDNGSVDGTAGIARLAGATVASEKRRGKGFVVRSMFQKTNADVFVIVDGDDTYPAEKVHALIAPVVSDEADMTVGSRLTKDSNSAFRLTNLFGNKLYQVVINTAFGTDLTDILSGYRAMSRNLVKGLPICVQGFEVEAELTIKALQGGFRIAEVPIDLRSRPEGSHSKIHILRDGFKILLTIFALFRDYKPLTTFGICGLIAILLGMVPGLVAVREYFATGLVMHFPSAILAVGLVLTGMLLIVVGLILHSVNRRVQEMEYLMRLLTDQMREA